MRRINLYQTAVALTAAIAAIGFAINYATLQAAAAAAGFAVWQSLLFPLLLDAGMIVAHVSYVAFRRAGRLSRWVVGAMYGSVILSVTFAISHATGNFTGDIAADALTVVAWAIAPVWLLVSVEVLAQLSQLNGYQPAQVSNVQPPTNKAEFVQRAKAGEFGPLESLAAADIAVIGGVAHRTAYEWRKAALNGKH